jgi:hypothetical protein
MTRKQNFGMLPERGTYSDGTSAIVPWNTLMHCRTCSGRPRRMQVETNGNEESGRGDPPLPQPLPSKSGRGLPRSPPPSTTQRNQIRDPSRLAADGAGRLCNEPGSRRRPSTPTQCDQRWRKMPSLRLMKAGRNTVRGSRTGSGHNDMGCRGQMMAGLR